MTAATPANCEQQWPHIKRLLELWNGVPAFRDRVGNDLDSIAAEFLLDSDSLLLAEKLWGEHSFTTHMHSRESFPELFTYKDRQKKLQGLRAHIRTDCDPKDGTFSRWRHSQMNRCSQQLSPELNFALIHMPICFELSLGCSVGCWFCGLNAPRLTEIFPYTAENSRLWQEILLVSQNLLGKSASHASLYWATEPFDNPDYEKFCLDFHSLFSIFPQTTTALSLSDSERTKNFINLSQENGCQLNRFSVSRLKDLHSLHTQFTAEELAQVELVLLNPGSLQQKANAGRLLKDSETNDKTDTISCCSGFLVNMVNKTVRMISPCPADKKYPNGYITFAEGFFHDAADFNKLLKEMIQTNMQTEKSTKTHNSISIGQTKRFLERWTSDPAFKKSVLEDPDQAVNTYKIGFHPKEIQFLWDRPYSIENSNAPVPRPVQQYREFIKKKFAHRDILRDQAASINKRLNGWRNRQMMRCISQLGPERHGSIVHAPFSVELNKGCSVGCWFCAYSAPKLSALFRYTDKNRTLWRETLQALLKIWGPGAKFGFCYWATEPLDNPDYEKFIIDFHEILDYFPQTTTATPLTNVARTKKLIALSRQNNGFVERFSMHSLEKLEEVYRNFSADELEWVELVTQNEESDMAYANAGKILAGSSEGRDQVVINESTIACVSGFLLNMVEKSVQLISPCIPSKRWPKGYIIYDEAHFNSGEELETVLNTMIDKHMALTVDRDQLLRFRHDLTMQPEPEGFSLHLKNPSYAANPHPVCNSQEQILHPELGKLALLIDEGNKTAGELALHFEEKYYIPPAETFHCINIIFSFGFLQEGPQ